MNSIRQLHAPDIDITDENNKLIFIHSRNYRGRGIGPIFSYIYDHTQDSFYHVDQEVFNVLGYQEEDIYKGGYRYLKSFIHPDDSTYVKQLTQQAWEVIKNRPTTLQKNYSVSIDFRVKHQYGSYIHVIQEAPVLTLNEQNNATYSLGTCYDITDWQKTTPSALNIYYRNNLLKRWSAEQPKRIELLSFREKEVMREVCKGLTSAEIAKKLSLSIHTVSTYMKTILRKLKLKGTSALIQFAFQNQLF
jgi:DNA-binding CsgD family transcriptional regulator